MSKSAIPYVTDAWPIVTGCSSAGAGCKNCWAARLAATRLKHHPHYEGLAEYRGGRGYWVAPPRFNKDILEAPLHWRKPRRVFVAQTGDLFHGDITVKQITEVFAVMALAQEHTFLVFTKRWERARGFLSSEKVHTGVGVYMGYLQGLTTPVRVGWPLPNVWVIFSASTQKEVNKCAPILLDTPAAKRGLSLEPLLECVVLEKLFKSKTKQLKWIIDGLDFLFAGGESSLRRDLARPCPVEAARSLRDQCGEYGVPFWWKQWGAHLPEGQIDNHTLDGVRYEEMPK